MNTRARVWMSWKWYYEITSIIGYNEIREWNKKESNMIYECDKWRVNEWAFKKEWIWIRWKSKNICKCNERSMRTWNKSRWIAEIQIINPRYLNSGGNGG